jgi:hypothetical protein
LAVYGGWIIAGIVLMSVFRSHFWWVFVLWLFVSWLGIYIPLERRRRRRIRDRMGIVETDTLN